MIPPAALDAVTAWERILAGLGVPAFGAMPALAQEVATAGLRQGLASFGVDVRNPQELSAVFAGAFLATGMVLNAVPVPVSVLDACAGSLRIIATEAEMAAAAVPDVMPQEWTP